MSIETIFRIHLVLGYVAWLMCFGVYIWPRLRSMDHIEAHRAIATLHSFRFFGLVFIVPGVVSPDLPQDFATVAAYGDFATGVLALLALRPDPDTSAVLGVGRRLQCRRCRRYPRRLLSRDHGRASGGRGRVRRHLCDPDHLCAAPDDHARRIVLSLAACATGGAGACRRNRCDLDWMQKTPGHVCRVRA